MVGNGVPLGSRGSVVTTSGLPHGQRWPTSWMARGSRPSWAAIAASSAGSITGLRPPGVSSGASMSVAAGGVSLGGLPARTTDCQASSNHGSGVPLQRLGRLRQLGLALQRLAVLAEHDVRRLAGHDVAEPLAGLGLDERRVVPAPLLALEVVDAGLALRDLRLQVGDVGPLLEVGAHRRGVGDGEHRDHQDQDRGPPGEAGAAPALGVGRTRPAPTGGRAAPRPAPVRPGPGRLRGRDPRGGVRRLSAIGPVSPGSAGRRRLRRSGRRRRARPRSGGAGCTWRPARTGPGRRS